MGELEALRFESGPGSTFEVPYPNECPNGKFPANSLIAVPISSKTSLSTSWRKTYLQKAKFPAKSLPPTRISEFWAKLEDFDHREKKSLYFSLLREFPAFRYRGAIAKLQDQISGSVLNSHLPFVTTGLHPPSSPTSV
jgi:hypothetical protein